jgi:hypothetical protein
MRSREKLVHLAVGGSAFGPWRHELRLMQIIAEAGAKQNTIMIILMASEFVEMA